MTHAVPEPIRRAARTTPDSVALVDMCQSDSPVRLTYRELDEFVGFFSASLRRAGVAAGVRVAVIAPAGFGWVVAAHALLRLRAVIVPINLRLTEFEMSALLDQAAVGFVVHHSDTAELARTVSGKRPSVSLPTSGGDEVGFGGFDGTSWLDLHSPASVFFTSGTSGVAQGATHDFGAWWHGALASAQHLGHAASDAWLLPMPLYHVGGYAILIRAAIAAIPIVLTPKFDPEQIARTIRSENVTLTSFVPTMLQDMLQVPELQCGALRTVLLGGAAAGSDLIHVALERGIPVSPTYGMTETASQIATLPPREVPTRERLSGRPLPHMAVAVADGDSAAAVGEGELLVRGLSLMTGYLGRPALDRDTWFPTGDMGIIDDRGYVQLLDRRTDLIISGGENIYPAELEERLRAIPGVAAACVVGVPDSRWGSVPGAMLIAANGVDPAEVDILAALAGTVAPFKMPKHIRWVNDFPTTSSGKILRREMQMTLVEELSEKGRRPG